MEQTTLTLGEIIENSVDIFDFSYPFYNENYRTTFEQHFIEHFYFDEIGQETIARFKQRLKIKLNLIMPYWNKILLADQLDQRILDNYDVTETFTKTVTNDITSTNENTTNSTIDSDTTNTNNSTVKNLESDTPVTKVDFETLDYFSNITKNIGNETNTNATNETNDITSNGTVTTNDTNNENWTRTMKGNIGIQTDADAVIKYWQSLRQIENEIFDQCSGLFMEVY